MPRRADSQPTPLPQPVLQDVAAMFGLMSATVRVHLLWLLSDAESDVGGLAAATGQSMATISHHLGKLKLAGLVYARRAGRRQVYVLADPDAAAIVRLAISRRMPPAGERRLRGAR